MTTNLAKFEPLLRLMGLSPLTQNYDSFTWGKGERGKTEVDVYIRDVGEGVAYSQVARRVQSIPTVVETHTRSFYGPLAETHLWLPGALEEVQNG